MHSHALCESAVTSKNQQQWQKFAAESREDVRKIDFNLIYLLESGTGRGPVPGLYNCSTLAVGYNWPKTETPADYLRGIATVTVFK